MDIVLLRNFFMPFFLGNKPFFGVATNLRFTKFQRKCYSRGVKGNRHSVMTGHNHFSKTVKKFSG